ATASSRRRSTRRGYGSTRPTGPTCLENRPPPTAAPEPRVPPTRRTMPPKDRPPLRVVTLSEHELRELAIEWTAEGYRRAAADFMPILKRYDGPEHKAILTV